MFDAYAERVNKGNFDPALAVYLPACIPDGFSNLLRTMLRWR